MQGFLKVPQNKRNVSTEEKSVEPILLLVEQLEIELENNEDA